MRGCIWVSWEAVLGQQFSRIPRQPYLESLPCFVAKWEYNIYLCAVSPLSSRHKKKIAFLAVGESQALNDKTVIYRDGCIRLDPLIIGKSNFDGRDLHSGWGYAPSVSGSEKRRRRDRGGRFPRKTNQVRRWPQLVHSPLIARTDRFEPSLGITISKLAPHRTQDR